MLTITKIIPDSPADNGRIHVGDKLLAIDGIEINDFIDYRYAEAEADIKLELARENETFALRINKTIDRSLGLEFAPDRIKRCRNNCVFCFCHNNPKHLRRSLYIKDDDYRYSFLHGSFITLTNLGEPDIERIIKFKLSPLYISVHATEMHVRRKIFGRKNIEPVLPLLQRLADNSIFFHSQVVVTPGYNDGEILRKTAADLYKLRPYAQSLAVVPVGLTRFSRPGLQAVGVKRAAQLIDEVSYFRKKYGSKENRFAYAADELFIKARQGLPPARYYDDFPQIENGVGMVRDFLDTIPRKLPSKINGLWVTGKSMMDVWRAQIIPKFKTKINLIPVENKLFGPKVTVTGLLSGEDILRRLKVSKIGRQIIILPPNCLNHDGLFIDDLTIADLQDKLQANILQGDYSFARTLELAL